MKTVPDLENRLARLVVEIGSVGAASRTELFSTASQEKSTSCVPSYHWRGERIGLILEFDSKAQVR